MTIKIKYVVLHKGEEKLVTTDKSEADRYDKMLNIADNISEFLISKNLIPENPDERTVMLLEAISIALSESKDDVKKILSGKAIDLTERLTKKNN